MNFVALYKLLDSTNSTLDKIEALRNFFVSATPAESALAVKLILGQLAKKRLKTSENQRSCAHNIQNAVLALRRSLLIGRRFRGNAWTTCWKK